MNRITALLESQGFIQLDGGLATALEAKGAKLEDALWSARLIFEHPQLIQAVNLDYLKAGADVVTTATYQASVEGFKNAGYSISQIEKIFHESVTIAQKARRQYGPDDDFRAKTPLIVGSLGPYGAYLADGSEYRGDYNKSVRFLMDFHKPRIEMLLSAGVECLAFETIPEVKETEAIARLMEQFEIPAWLSWSTRDEQLIAEREPLAFAVEIANDLDAFQALGFNCMPPRRIPALLDVIRPLTDKALVVYPNSGEKWDAKKKAWRPAAHTIDWAKAASNWYARGARLIGGCCRTTPPDIIEMKRALRRCIEN